MKIINNLPNNGLCPCGYPYDENGVCSNPNCPTKSAYDAGYRAQLAQPQFPIVEEDDGD